MCTDKDIQEMQSDVFVKGKHHKDDSHETPINKTRKMQEISPEDQRW